MTGKLIGWQSWRLSRAIGVIVLYGTKIELIEGRFGPCRIRAGYSDRSIGGKHIMHKPDRLLKRCFNLLIAVIPVICFFIYLNNVVAGSSADANSEAE